MFYLNKKYVFFSETVFNLFKLLLITARWNFNESFYSFLNIVTFYTLSGIFIITIIIDNEWFSYSNQIIILFISHCFKN